MKIDTQGHPPIRLKPHRLGPEKMKVAEAEVKKMLEQSVVRRSYSNWSSPIVMVKKKDGSIRLCVDYRALNKITKDDNYPMPLIDDLVGTLHQAKWFSAMDLTSGYYQVMMAPEDIEKTAFTTGEGLYEHLRMPFGLKNAPAAFQRALDHILRGLQWNQVPTFMDDCNVWSIRQSQHLKYAAQLFEIFRQFGIKMSPKKCSLGRNQVEYLGFKVNRDGIFPLEKKLKSILEYVAPHDRTFLGMASFYRRFVKGHAEIAAPMTALTSVNVAFDWSKEAQESFKQMKMAMAEVTVMAISNPGKEFVLQTDASKFGLGAVSRKRMMRRDV